MTAISWTDETWNPVTGCDRTSPGCDNCYALTMAGRLKLMGQAKYQNDGDPLTSGPGFGVTCHPEELHRPLKWRKERRVFVCSMSDLFHHDVPDEFILDVWATMVASSATFQVLTKRSRRLVSLLSGPDTRQAVEDRVHDLGTHMFGGWPYPTIWVGTSVESDRYTFRVDHLRATPAAVRFVSLEPLLGPLPSLDLTGIDWAIIGCESGPRARPFELDWCHDILDKARTAGTAVFVKQLPRDPSNPGRVVTEPDLFPTWLQLREWPHQ
jgi:protein gp37